RPGRRRYPARCRGDVRERQPSVRCGAMEPSRSQRIEGGLVGLLIGDALGVPYEFFPPQRLPPIEAIEMRPPAGFPRAHAGVPPGTWSDDGAQALVLLDSLLACDGLDLRHFADGLARWL